MLLWFNPPPLKWPLSHPHGSTPWGLPPIIPIPHTPPFCQRPASACALLPIWATAHQLFTKPTAQLAFCRLRSCGKLIRAVPALTTVWQGLGSMYAHCTAQQCSLQAVGSILVSVASSEGFGRCGHASQLAAPVPRPNDSPGAAGDPGADTNIEKQVYYFPMEIN